MTIPEIPGGYACEARLREETGNLEMRMGEKKKRRDLEYIKNLKLVELIRWGRKRAGTNLRFLA